MKYLVAIGAFLSLTGSVWASDVGVSVRIGQPGFYGHIEVGNIPQPQVIYPAPVIIQPVPVGVIVQPIYLRVPPGHERNWRRHCREYNACGQPVYFVQQGWYSDAYAPNYRDGSDQNYGEHGHYGSRHDRRKKMEDHGDD